MEGDSGGLEESLMLMDPNSSQPGQWATQAAGGCDLGRGRHRHQGGASSDMEHGEGEAGAKRSKLSAATSSFGSSSSCEDRLSALPDDILLDILRWLDGTMEAARTSVLSRRWRRLWVLLPDFHFFLDAKLDSVRTALESPAIAAHEAPPALRNLQVIVWDASPDSLAAWLPVAVHRLSGKLFLINMVGEEAQEREGTVELPCFENATVISLDLGFIGITVPSSGIFTRLTNLYLRRVRLHGPFELGDVISSPRCPSLRKLSVIDAQGLTNFTVHSESLLEIQLKRLLCFQQLTVVAPSLKILDVLDCYDSGPNWKQPVANISAPQLRSLKWMDAYDPSSVQLGEMAQLQFLAPNFFL